MSERLTEWQKFYLDRLEHLEGIRETKSPPKGELETLLSKAIYSTYKDCIDQGVHDQAQAILRIQTQPSQSNSAS